MRNLVFVAVLAALAAPAMAVPSIDAVVSPGEWDGAAVLPVTGGMGTVSVYANTDYLYALFNLLDSTDARLGQPHGNDATSMNINPTDGTPWGHPYDLIFATGADPASWGGADAGMTDGWHSEWSVENTPFPLPADVETATIFSGGIRISEWRIPLDTINPWVGDILHVGGSADIDVGVGSYPYPVGLVWNDSTTYADIVVHEVPPVVPVPSALLLVGIGSGVVSWLRRRSAI